jgi:hypothetical protein
VYARRVLRGGGRGVRVSDHIVPLLDCHRRPTDGGKQPTRHKRMANPDGFTLLCLKPQAMHEHPRGVTVWKYVVLSDAESCTSARTASRVSCWRQSVSQSCPLTPLQNCLFTPELQWQPRGDRRISQGWVQTGNACLRQGHCRGRESWWAGSWLADGGSVPAWILTFVSEI